jgi:hypothetical protein
MSAYSFKVTSMHQLKGIMSGATSAVITQYMLMHMVTAKL